LLVPSLYQLITPIVQNLTDEQGSVLADRRPESWSASFRLASKDTLIRFLSPFLLLVVSSISLSLIPFAPLGSFVVLSLTLTFYSIVSHVTLAERWSHFVAVFVFDLFLWLLSSTSSDPSLHPYSMAHVINPPPYLINTHYPIISYTSYWMEFTAGGLCLVSLLLAIYLSSDSVKLSSLGPHLILYSFSLLTIYVGIYFQNFSSYLYGHLGILIFSFISFELHPLLILLSNFLLIYTSSFIQSQSILLIGPIESLSNLCLGPVGILVFTLYTLFLPHSKDNKDFNCLLAFFVNVLVIFISAQLSRSLMFVVGLIGIASCLLWLGFMRIRGQGSFILILVIFAAVILGIAVRGQ
jgi:hypothetical protein